MGALKLWGSHIRSSSSCIPSSERCCHLGLLCQHPYRHRPRLFFVHNRDVWLLWQCSFVCLHQEPLALTTFCRVSHLDLGSSIPSSGRCSTVAWYYPFPATVCQPPLLCANGTSHGLAISWIPSAIWINCWRPVGSSFTRCICCLLSLSNWSCCCRSVPSIPGFLLP